MKPIKDPEVLKGYINRIYQAVTAPEQFAHIMSDLRQVIDAPYSAFQVENVYTNELRQASLIGYDGQSIDTYTDYYVTCDPWSSEVLKKGLVDTPFLPSHKILDDASYRESEFYRDWGRHHGVRHAIGTGVTLDEGFIFKANFQRHTDQACFSEDIEVFLNWLKPHLEHFVRLSSVFDQAHLPSENWQKALLQINRPIWVVNEDLRLITHNQCAQQWLSEGSILSCKEGTLTTSNHRQQNLLKTKVATLLEMVGQDGLQVMGNSAHQFDQLRLGDAVENESFWLSAVVNGEQPSENLVMIVGRKPIPDIQTLMNNHSLTQRQAQVCLLIMQGLTPQLASAKLGISINTFRNTLATCFRLLKVNNQSELIRLLFSY